MTDNERHIINLYLLEGVVSVLDELTRADHDKQIEHIPLDTYTTLQAILFENKRKIMAKIDKNIFGNNAQA